MRLVLHKPLLRHQYRMGYRYYLGFGYLQAYLRQHLPDVEVRVVHSEAEIRPARPDVVGFSTVTEIWPHVCGLYRRLREWFDGPVLFGGPHITALPQLLPRGNNIAFLGEGEVALTRFTQRLLGESRGLSRSNPVPGTATWVGDRLVYGPPAELVDINTLPPPADAPSDAFPLTTVRGCPYHCTHCVERATQGPPRQMSAERLAELVIDRYERYGTTVFELLDDVFLVSPKRLRAFVDILDQRGLLERFEFLRLSLMAHLITDQVAQTLARMNLRLAGMGVESADPEILRRFKNGVVRREHLERAIKACTRYGVGVGSSMVLGYPGETERQMRNTIDFYAEHIHKTSFEYWETYVCQPLPGSTLWHEALKAGRVGLDMDFSTLRIDADVNNFDTDWHYDNQSALPRRRFLEVLREYDLIRDGFFVRDPSTIRVTPKTDVFVRQYVPENVARRMTLQTLKAWHAADGRPVAVFGAGKHTRKVMPALIDSPVPIATIVDDDPDRIGTRLGRWNVVSPVEMTTADIGAVLVSSDMRQDELVARLRPLVEGRYRLLTIYEPEQLGPRRAGDPPPVETALTGAP
ncbi:MAG TPA: radical SAM protein [Phycisphaerae bacterium]|nr:radical SAM protein [Phycisphaerae bacterium]